MTNVTRTFMFEVTEDTHKYPEIELRLFLKHIPGWFENLGPALMQAVMEEEARLLTATYPIETRSEL